MGSSVESTENTPCSLYPLLCDVTADTENTAFSIVVFGGPGSSPGLVMWDFVVDKVALGKVFSEYFGFPCQSSFHQLLHEHPHLSSGACTTGQKWPQYQVDLVPPPKKMLRVGPCLQSCKMGLILKHSIRQVSEPIFIVTTCFPRIQQLPIYSGLSTDRLPASFPKELHEHASFFNHTFLRFATVTQKHSMTGTNHEVCS
jgi:hypothetical protein